MKTSETAAGGLMHSRGSAPVAIMVCGDPAYMISTDVFSSHDDAMAALDQAESFINLLMPREVFGDPGDSMGSKTSANAASLAFSSLLLFRRYMVITFRFAQATECMSSAAVPVVRRRGRNSCLCALERYAVWQGAVA